MRPTTLKTISARLLASTALIALVAAAPVKLNFDADHGVLALKSGTAQAKDGDSSGSGSDGGGGGDSSGSGSGGDSSGSGSGSDDGDDSSGSGSDDGDDRDDNDNSGSGSSDDDDDDADDDNSGPGSGDDDNDDGDASESRSVSDASGAKVEISGNNIEVTYPDGTKEEIENGVYERKDATGETVEERPATQTDRSSLGAAAAALGNSVSVEREFTRADGTKVEVTGNNIEAALGNSVSVEREFTRADGTKVEVTGNNIEVEFANGWKEEIEAGRFEMKDPNGNTVVERPATDADRARLEAQIPG